MVRHEYIIWMHHIFSLFPFLPFLSPVTSSDSTLCQEWSCDMCDGVTVHRKRLSEETEADGCIQGSETDNTRGAR